MKANHNTFVWILISFITVSYGSKILKWKQITTRLDVLIFLHHCFLWFKDTKMKANHNFWASGLCGRCTVSYGSKILKWKQITTSYLTSELLTDCFLWFKDTKMKANHNTPKDNIQIALTVSYGSKILKWKQITTDYHTFHHGHKLFPMVQRY